jgi:2,3-diketo-5-methylthio-1-phosphopentane phosphatase
MHIFCDFDGTITTCDTTDLVLSRLAAPEWEALERQWVDGDLTAAECMRAQVALIEGDQAALDATLDEIELCAGFTEFVVWARSNDIPLTIISDGVDYFIQRILARHDLTDLPIFSNRLAGAPGSWRLEQPWALSGCTALTGVCKCGAARISGFAERGRKLIFIGDGRSDLCLSQRADILFAKDWLAEQARNARRSYSPFETFHDVIAALSPIVSASGRDEAVA